MLNPSVSYILYIFRFLTFLGVYRKMLTCFNVQKTHYYSHANHCCNTSVHPDLVIWFSACLFNPPPKRPVCSDWSSFTDLRKTVTVQLWHHNLTEVPMGYGNKLFDTFAVFILHLVLLHDQKDMEKSYFLNKIWDLWKSRKYFSLLVLLTLLKILLETLVNLKNNIFLVHEKLEKQGLREIFPFFSHFVWLLEVCEMHLWSFVW